ncbi:hypothetical protein MtrunA17_Chr7g0276611 [Medicago truncatula]|uniref:Transmembrane protein n=1 Tax=Medicago truncatula TaxID=3880 RepID=A0A396HEA5_MEDTR|nr:hypothetical protein MtrunA17_Chr7g0276611 [Medicago truncatula]
MPSFFLKFNKQNCLPLYSSDVFNFFPEASDASRFLCRFFAVLAALVPAVSYPLSTFSFLDLFFFLLESSSFPPISAFFLFFCFAFFGFLLKPSVLRNDEEPRDWSISFLISFTLFELGLLFEVSARKPSFLVDLVSLEPNVA